jgi:hypothetical protein
MCNVPIYFYNIDIKHLQYTSKIFETLEIDACNMQFQRKHLLAVWENGSSSAVEFYPGRRELHVGEFHPGHDELGRRA